MSDFESSTPENNSEKAESSEYQFVQEPKKKGGLGIVIAGAAIIILALILLRGNDSLSSFENDWQAVFLTNGQVYFGKIVKQNKSEVVLKDIYYLQVVGALQQGSEAQKKDNKQGELSLVKLGNELHGPTDNMYINRDQVLFIEDLKEDGNVGQAIKNYKSEKK